MNIKLRQTEQKKVSSPDDIYAVMQRILLRENQIDRSREHFWTIGLDAGNHIVNIELVSMGTSRATLVDPMQVYSIPLQKQTMAVVLVHNHPGGSLVVSENDKDLTDRLIQVGLIMKVPVLDHLIITEKSFYSFKDSGLLDELSKSTKYVPAYKLRERYEAAATEKGIQQGMAESRKQIARALKEKGIDLETIAATTGLSKQSINRLKTEDPPNKDQ